MYVTVGRDRLCLILGHVVMPPIARGQTWLFQTLPVSTVPNTGRNQSDSGYRGLDEEEHLFCLCLTVTIPLFAELSQDFCPTDSFHAPSLQHFKKASFYKQLRGLAKKFKKKSEFTREVGGWDEVPLGIFFIENHPKIALNQC